MQRVMLAVAVLVLLVTAGGAACTSTSIYYSQSGYGTYGYSYSGEPEEYRYLTYHVDEPVGDVYYYCQYSGSFTAPSTYISFFSHVSGTAVFSDPHWSSPASGHHDGYNYFDTSSGNIRMNIQSAYMYPTSGSMSITVSPHELSEYIISGDVTCIDYVNIYVQTDIGYNLIDSDSSSFYEFNIIEDQNYRLLFSDGAYYDFTCTGNEVFDYDACTWVYGYTCGIDTIVLRDDNSQIVDQTSQSSGYDVYEMEIVDGEEYTISFYDMGILLCYSQTFTCTGDHVLIDFDRCNWVYPPSPWDDPYIIYLWAGYDFNIVVFKDEHGNFIENSQLAIYDKTDGQYIQRWSDASDGYALLGAKFATDHDVQLMVRTFDGIFTLDTTYPANGSAAVGEEDITTTNWTIPIKYNLNVLPVDNYGSPLFDVFCGLSEYTPLNPGAFWGMDLSDQGYVPVTNCSGFAMCDIIAEKEGYVDYRVEALNWTSKSAMVKDYRHNVVMEEE